MGEVLKLRTEQDDITLRNRASPAEDAALFYALKHDMEPSGDFASLFPTPKSVTDERKRDDALLRMAIWRNDVEFVGEIAASTDRGHAEDDVEIGYWLRISKRGNGYATVAVKAISEYLDAQGLRAVAHVFEGNQASVDVLQRVGFEEIQRTTLKERPSVLFGYMS